MEKQKNRGITLIALVVSIIVLLILAGISISMLTGQNGILQRASEAKEQTEAAQKEEQTTLSTYEDYIYEYTSEIEVEQVTDTNPGALEGSGTEVDPYVINSIEDLVFFAHDVTNGNNYKGEYVNLGLSLDFNSSKSYVNAYRTDYGTYGYNGELKTLLTIGNGFIPIGSIEDQAGTTDFSNAKAFLGEFDGNNNTIANLYINQSVTNGVNYQYFGLFTHNFGIIKNLKVNGNIEINVATNNVAVGLIAGIVIGENSNIENCCSSGIINIDGTSLPTDYYIATGGIVGQVNFPEGQVNKCRNESEIIVKGDKIYIGGITGSNNAGKVYTSYNIGKITAIGQSEVHTRCGGIVGTSASAGEYIADIQYCYNIGEVKGNIITGGIVGADNSGTAKNCQYNNGELLGLGRNTSQEEEELNNIIKNENLTIEEILILLKNIM